MQISLTFSIVAFTIAQFQQAQQPVPQPDQVLIQRHIFLANLNVDTEALVEGLYKAVGLVPSLEPPKQDIILWTLRNPRFQYWFQSRHSSFLAIKPQGVVARTSPCSLLCATLLSEISNLSRVIPLYAFCFSMLDDVSSTQFWLLRGLVSQLITAICPETIALSPYEDVYSHADPNPLWNVFAMLLAQLKDCAVFCIIDGLAYYHDRQEALFLIQGFQGLITDINPSITLRILLTGGLPHEAWPSLPAEQLLLLPAVVARTGNGFRLDQVQGLLWT